MHLEGLAAPLPCVGDETVLEVIKFAGIATRTQLGAFLYSQRQQIDRVGKFLKQATLAKHAQQHLTATVRTGTRPVCCACNRTGTISKALIWITGHCDAVCDFDTRPVLANLQAQEEHLKALLQQLAKLRC